MGFSQLFSTNTKSFDTEGICIWQAWAESACMEDVLAYASNICTESASTKGTCIKTVCTRSYYSGGTCIGAGIYFGDACIRASTYTRGSCIEGANTDFSDIIVTCVQTTCISVACTSITYAKGACTRFAPDNDICIRIIYAIKCSKMHL